ncbi:hypothetical protein HD806DRAFT_514306 [Xylariaceae sp. AK1471]|nr:hypothetical protein HD806DRAFT_514306 [Xylariaceae sp. AK1471]
MNPSASTQTEFEDHSSVVIVVSIFLLITSTLVVLTRLVTKWVVSKRYHIDDGLLVVSQVFNVLQVVGSSISVSNGLLKQSQALTPGNIASFQKSIYLANIASVICQAIAKISAILLIQIISPSQPHRTLVWLSAGATSLWAVSALGSLIFQCKLPRVWDFLANECIDRRALWYYINSFNIGLEIIHIILPVAVVWNLHTRLRRKVSIVSCFAVRIFSIAAISWQVGETKGISKQNDEAMSYWRFLLAMILVQNLGVITTSVPYLKPFFDSLESGMIRSDDIRRRGGSSKAASSGHDQSYGSGTPLPRQSGKPIQSDTHELQSFGHEASGPLASASVTTGRSDTNADWEAASHSSQSNLIKIVRTWGVTSGSSQAEHAEETPDERHVQSRLANARPLHEGVIM